MEDTHTAFFYGTLMAPEVLHRVVWGQTTPPTPAHASLLHIRPAILHGHQRHAVLEADYPAVIPSKERSNSVRGTLVTGLTDGDIWRLDIFEGEDYERQKVRVRPLLSSDEPIAQQKEEDNVEGEEVEAETYIWIAGAEALEKGEWDFDAFVREKMGRWIGHDSDADEGFRDVEEAVANDPTGGRGANGKITQQLDLEKGRGGKAEEEVLGGAV